jgi:hypothetical protein
VTGDFGRVNPSLARSLSTSTFVCTGGADWDLLPGKKKQRTNYSNTTVQIQEAVKGQYLSVTISVNGNNLILTLEEKYIANATMPVTKDEFEAFFPRLVDDITAHSGKYGLPDQAQEWFRAVSLPI